MLRVIDQSGRINAPYSTTMFYVSDRRIYAYLLNGNERLFAEYDSRGKAEKALRMLRGDFFGTNKEFKFPRCSEVEL